MFSCIKFEVVSALLVGVSSFVVCQIHVVHETNGVCNMNASFACKRISNCPSALENITKGRRPNICSFEGNEPLVCCDLRRSTGLQQGNVDAIMTVSNPSENNGHLQSPFGRLNLTDDSFGRLESNGPTTVEGSSESRNNHSSDPSTTTITEGWGFLPPPPLIPGISNTKSEQKCLEYRSRNCIDVYFIEGGVPAKLNQFPHMALIGFGPENDKSWQCGGSVISRRYILSAAHFGPTSNHLLYINISFVNPEKCKGNLQNKLSKSHFPDGITDSIVCAGEADGSKDSCQGDSGGPLFIKQKNQTACPYTQIGIISTGLPCAQEDSPGIYTRVSSYIPWIESIVWKNDP